MNEKGNKELVGVKGWLLFFTVVFLILFPFVSINRLFFPIFDSYENPLLYNIIQASVGLFSLLTGILIIIKSSKTKIFLQIFLLLFLLNSIPVNTVYQDMGNQIIKILYVTTVITIVYLYFRDSERVKNTLIR